MTGPSTTSPRRALLPTSHSDLRVTWHADADVLVLTLWSGERCTGSAPLDAAQAAELLAFVARCLAQRTTDGAQRGPTAMHPSDEAAG